MKLTTMELSLRLGVSLSQLYRNQDVQVLKKREGKGNYWLSEDIEIYEANQKSKEEKEKNAPIILTKDDRMSPKLESNFKYWVRNMDGTIIYRCKKDINEWKKVKPDSNVFNYLHQIEYKPGTSVYEHLYNIYASELYNGENFLRLKGEVNKIPELSQKIVPFYKFIQNDKNFFIDTIESFTNDKEKMSFKFFDLDNIEIGAHKHWDIWEQQLKKEDVDVFRAFVYSIFFAKDKNRQTLWLNDPGYRGKTKVMNAITKFGGDHFGNSLKSESLYRNKHYGTYIEGYRLLLFDDNTNPFLISDGIFKSVTGGGQITIDEKGVSGMRSYIPNVKVIISSNMKPIIQNQDSDLTRLILMDILKPTKENSDYMVSVVDLEDVLCDELKYYLRTCKESYTKLCPTYTHIKLTENQMLEIENCQNSDDSIISNFFNTYFETSDIKNSILKTEFDMCKNDYEANQQVKMDYSKVLRYLGSYNIKQSKKTVDNIINTTYTGVKLKPWWRFEEGRLECQSM